MPTSIGWVLLILMQAFLIASQHPFTVSFNRHFLKAGHFSIDTSRFYHNASAAPWNPLTFIVGYAEAGFSNEVNTTSVVIVIYEMYI